ncbi:class I SAM-dependent methyltransferase [Massilia sp. PWRC2]|uniref:class I SAM-dependent methyltransferase n=1 Tax=Massilia sp. PWRC2 TaxID=2804626 RepID=UPI003CE6D3F7
MKKVSWRDPSGFVAKKDGRIFRAVASGSAAQVQALMDAPWYRDGVERGWFPASAWVENNGAGLLPAIDARWLEHRSLQFPVYPHEITALQLYDAAKLTLAIAQTALANGWMIKDASAWNVLFEHGRPCFCDILSFEPVDDTGIWQAYAQFFRHFIIPLLIHRATGVQPAAWFVLHRDGVEPAAARPMLGGWRAWQQPALEAVTLPSLFAHAGSGAVGGRKPRPVRSRELARFVLTRTLGRLEKHIDRLMPVPRGRASKWENYEADRDHYVAADVSAKTAFVTAMLKQPGLGTVLDLGCNAGEFSKVAAAAGKTVVAADFDPGALSRLYAQLRKQQLPIAPILLDIGRPTPAVGWMNQEVESFMDRARGQFDCVMALGLVHHLLVSERASLGMILAFFLALDPSFLLLEWIAPDDRRFAEIAGMNEALYAGLSQQAFEESFAQHYVMEAKETLAAGGRTMYFFSKRPAG